MAWSVTARGGSSGYETSPDVGDTAFTPADNSLIIIASVAWDANVTGGGGWSKTFYQIGANLAVGSNVMKVFAAKMGTTPGSDRASIATSGQLNHDTVVFEVTGHDDSLSIANIFPSAQWIQEATYGGVSANPIGTGFPSAFASSTNATLVVNSSYSKTQTWTPQSGFASIVEHSILQGSVDVHWNDVEEADPEYDANEGSDDIGAIALEVVEASGGGGGLGIPLIMHDRRMRYNG